MTRNFLVSALLNTALLSLPLRAQFDNLVTTDDGSALLFQSQWRTAGSGDSDLGKIFRWDSHGFTTVFSPHNPGLISPPSASNPIISGDGTITGYLSYPGCAGAACSTTTYSLALSGATLPASLPATSTFQISRNGRYLAAGTTVLDRNTGAVQTIQSSDPSVSPFPIGGRFGIGNNGGVLFLALHKVFIFSTVDLVLSSQPGVKIVNTPVVYTAVVSAVENRVVYETYSGVNGQTDRQLWSFDMASGQSALLEDIDFGTYIGISQYQPAISNDGMRLLYRRLNPATHAWEAVVHDYASGANAVVGTMLPSRNNLTITGDGKAAWLHRDDGRLVRIAIDTLAATETTGRHAWFSQREGAPVFGSYNHLFGGGFATGSAVALPPDLSVDLSGVAVPILTATTGQLDIEIPWETSPGNFTLTLRNSSSPFESVLPIDLVGAVPTFERTGLPNDAIRLPAVVHQDFRGLVTFSDPAAAGEIVHLYMTGLGDVQPRPPTGKTSPFLSVASQHPLCWLLSPFSQTLTTAPVLFAGIAPGLVGMYQVDVAIPASTPSSLATMGCFDEGGAQGLAGDVATFNIK
ncbi:MAG TPA: hypothetical protein VEU96_26620 [Bryobacteraceae bacterium]|nr:hypothetical protein [Bryobacteraceae bacterium]